ncbi:MAG: SRPBCC family protein [Acidobacteriota bacterium]
MAKVTVIGEFNASADQTWQVIGGFNALPAWHPDVQRSELNEGKNVRTLTLVDGGTVIEKLELQSEESREYRYSLVRSSLPVSDYQSTLKVSPRGEGSQVEWTGEFEPSGVSADEAVALIHGIYQAGLDNLKQILHH